MQLENLNWFPLFCISFQTGLFGFEISQSRPCKQKNVLLHERVLLLHCWQRYSCAYWNNETMISPISIVHDHLQNVMGIFYEYRIVSTYADWLNHADCVSLKPSPHWQTIVGEQFRKMPRTSKYLVFHRNGEEEQCPWADAERIFFTPGRSEKQRSRCAMVRFMTRCVFAV